MLSRYMSDDEIWQCLTWLPKKGFNVYAINVNIHGGWTPALKKGSLKKIKYFKMIMKWPLVELVATRNAEIFEPLNDSCFIPEPLTVFPPDPECMSEEF